MRQEEIAMRDIHDDRDANPVVETELGELLERHTYKDGTVDWIEPPLGFVSQATASLCDDAYAMGIAANEKGHPFRRPDEPVIDAYQKGKDDGYNTGYMEGYQDGLDKALVLAKAEIDKLVASYKGKHGND